MYGNEKCDQTLCSQMQYAKMMTFKATSCDMKCHFIFYLKMLTIYLSEMILIQVDILSKDTALELSSLTDFTVVCKIQRNKT